MYGVPADFPVEVLIKERLIQVCIGENDLILNFSANSNILITSSVRVDSEEITSDFRASAADICKFVGTRIIDIKVGKQYLELAFEGGCLRMFDDSDQFESIVCRVGNRTIVI